VLRIWDVLILVFIHPGSRILYLGSNNGIKRGGGQFFFVLPLFCCHKYHTIINNFIFEYIKNLVFSQNNICLFTQRFVIKRSNTWVWDPGSGKKNYPGSRVKKAPDSGSGSATLRGGCSSFFKNLIVTVKACNFVISV
jgi:hypothetical protein